MSSPEPPVRSSHSAPPSAAGQVSGAFLLSGGPSPVVRQAVRNGVLLLAVVAILVALSYQAFEVLGAARAYVGGEGLWSKAQRDAVYHLEHYAASGDTAEYQAYQRALIIPLGDGEARLELDRPHPDYARIRQGFLRGGNHPDDIERMIVFYRRFHTITFVHEAIVYWAGADSLIAELTELGEGLHQWRTSGPGDATQVRATLTRIHQLNEDVSRMEFGFSAALSRGARLAGTVGSLLMFAAAALLLALVGLSEWRTLRHAREAELILRESEARHREVVEHASMGIVRSRADGTLLQVNPAMVQMLGYRDEAEFLSRQSAQRIYKNPADRDRILQMFEARGQVHAEFELEMLKRDGTSITVRARARVLRDATGRVTGYEKFIEDVTDQRALEAQLRQSQKMEAVGQLTGGIAHDFNNLLSVIVSTAQLAEDALEEDPAMVRAELGEIRSAAQRGADMIRKLLAFSRTRQLHFRPFELGELVGASTSVLRRLLPAHIEIRLEAPASTPHVRTDPAALEQIMLNLATNARDAMPGGGHLDITVSTVARHETGDGPWVLLTLRDTGVGMDATVRERIYEPFYTTKAPGQGTGLGMTMVYGLMKQHGGVVEVDSAPGEGTEIRLYFPLATPDRQLDLPGTGQAARGSGTILVVEDETALRRATQRLLERNGYQVLTAGDGAEALTTYFRHAGAIDLILSDVVMPHLSGAQLYHAIRDRGELVPFLFMSGYLGEAGNSTLALPKDVALLAKPWGIDDLLHSVADTLRAAGSGSQIA